MRKLFGCLDSTDVARFRQAGMIVEWDELTESRLYVKTSTGIIQIFADGKVLVGGVGFLTLGQMTALGDFARKMQGFSIIP